MSEPTSYEEAFSLFPNVDLARAVTIKHEVYEVILANGENGNVSEFLYAAPLPNGDVIMADGYTEIDGGETIHFTQLDQAGTEALYKLSGVVFA